MLPNLAATSNAVPFVSEPAKTEPTFLQPNIDFIISDIEHLLLSTSDAELNDDELEALMQDLLIELKA